MGENRTNWVPTAQTRGAPPVQERNTEQTAAEAAPLIPRSKKNRSMSQSTGGGRLVMRMMAMMVMMMNEVRRRWMVVVGYAAVGPNHK